MACQCVIATTKGERALSTAAQFDACVSGIVEEKTARIEVGGVIPPESNRDLLRDALAGATSVVQLGDHFGEIVPVLCSALEQPGCVIAEVHVDSLRAPECDMLARAISNNESLQTLVVYGKGFEGLTAANATVELILASRECTPRVRKVEMGVMLKGDYTVELC